MGINSCNNNTVGIIPARYTSTRLPGKPLLDIAGKSMIQRVCEQVSLSELNHLIVATDDARIFEHVKALGYEAIMTNEHHPSGTDRIAEVAQKYSNQDIIINIQGDEPFIQPEAINELLGLLKRDDVGIGTLAHAFTAEADVMNPNQVKLTMDQNGKCLYFSRSPIPYCRNRTMQEAILDKVFLKHIGMYGFKNHVLREIAALPLGNLELIESLEQLRWLEAGYSIHAAQTHFTSFGIDSMEDLELARKMIKLE